MSEQRPPNHWLLALIPLTGVVLAVVLFWPAASTPLPAPVSTAAEAPAPAPATVAVAPAPRRMMPEAPLPPPPKKDIPTFEDWVADRDPSIPSTRSCYDILTLKWQGTHDFITQELIRDRGTMYQMDDLACLTAEGGVGDAIIGHVERYQDRRQFLEKYQDD